MKTAIEIVDIIYSHLNVSDILTAITGKVYKMRRPSNSNVIDITINTLAANNEQLERGLANVNIHVPNVTMVSNGEQDNSQPDIAKLRSLTTLAISKLDDISADDYILEVQQNSVFEDTDNTNEHYSNIRINFYCINL